jgi:hypothetical protein
MGLTGTFIVNVKKVIMYSLCLKPSKLGCHWIAL